MYAIIDIETTGGSPRYERITEIALLIHDGEKVVNEFTTLINPERFIPAHITALTGITNEMVADAPRFFEIAEKLVKLTENKVFVAHNVSFDYGFIKAEFRSLGYTFTRDRLCTVRLSRKLIPGLRSYSLGNLCSELSIKIQNRHRALGDAMATARLFDLLLTLNAGSGLNLFNAGANLFNNLNPLLDPDKLRDLPEETGVYYFHDENGNILYIGKSKNIRSRVYTHLSNNSTHKSIELKQKVADISFELTGSELVALLKESSEIKKHKPLYNRSQRRSMFRYGLYHRIDEHGYMQFSIERSDGNNSIPLTSFSSKKEGTEFLYAQVEKFELCQRLCGLYQTKGNCFHYEIMKCRGACIGIESPDAYNLRASGLVNFLSGVHSNIILFDKGRNAEEYSVVKVKNGKYLGFGYINSGEAVSDPGQLDDFIGRYNDDRDVQQILRTYLRNHRVLKMIFY